MRVPNAGKYTQSSANVPPSTLPREEPLPAPAVCEAKTEDMGEILSRLALSLAALRRMDERDGFIPEFQGLLVNEEEVAELEVGQVQNAVDVPFECLDLVVGPFDLSGRVGPPLPCRLSSIEPLGAGPSQNRFRASGLDSFAIWIPPLVV